MEKKTPGFSLDDLVPSEEAASGMHVPVGEMMFAIPNKADDEEIEEEGMEKEALGLTSMPQSLYGGEVLDLPGSPQPSGLSREQGEDEETEFFGAKEEGVDLPPEHYKTQKKQGISEDDETDEEFFDFLFTNKSHNFLREESNMRHLIEKLAEGLDKVGEKDAALVALALTDDRINYSESVKPPAPDNSAPDSRKDEIYKKLVYDFGMITDWLYRPDGEFTPNKLEKMWEMLKQRKPALSDDRKAEFMSLAKEWGMQDRYGESSAEEVSTGEGVLAKPAEQPSGGVTPVAKPRSGWEGYFANGGPKGMKAAWEAWVAANPNQGYDASFLSWVKWYRKQVTDRTIPSGGNVDAVLRLLGGAAPAAPAAKTDEAAKPAEDTEPPIAEEGKPPREAMEEYFRAISSKTREARIAGPLRLRNARVRRRIRRLGDPAAAVEAVLSFRGGGDVEKGLALYDSYDQTQTPEGTEERGGKTVSTYKMSEFQNKAVSDILTLKVRDYRAGRGRTRRSVAFEDRQDQLLKMAAENS